MMRQNYKEVETHKYELEAYDIFEERKKVRDHWYHKMPENWAVYSTCMKRSDRPHTWGLTKVEIEKDGQPYMDFIRNYPSIPVLYVKQNEEEFLITSEDYQCITIINLTKKEKKTYGEIDDLRHGAGFCPISFDWDDGDLYVEGCIWACPEETMIAREIDLNNPTSAFNCADWQSDYDDDQYCDDDDDDDWEDETENC